MTYDDNRYWITNPVGHRSIPVPYTDGEMVETIFGLTEMIVPPAPPADEWICDMCNEPILVKYGDEPFPVPMLGGYALCLDHFNEVVEHWTHDDPDTGEPTDIPMGDWPMQSCGCMPCTLQTMEWIPMLKSALGV